MKKLLPFKSLVKKADAVFSEYIRIRDKRRFSGRCMICNTRPIEVCFHFISRADFATRWEPDNSVGSCRGCNYNESVDRRQKNRDKYKRIHESIVGKDRRRELEIIAADSGKFDRSQVQGIINRLSQIKLAKKSLY